MPIEFDRLTRAGRSVLRPVVAGRGANGRWQIALLVAGWSVLFFVSPSPGQVIRFDEFPADNDSGAMPANRYAALGVTFQSADEGATWGGNSAGDPGAWSLEGTNGPIFSGFNGGSYALTMLFNTDVHSFSLDVSRSNGSIQGDQFTLAGYLNGGLVDSETITLGPINSWSTVSLTGVIDETRWSGQGVGFHPFGVDNVRWTAVPEPASITLCLLSFGWVCVFRRRRLVGC